MDAFEARRAGLEQLHQLAASVADELVGMDREYARARVAGHPGMSIRFAAEHEPMTAELVMGRITAVIREGVVISAGPG